MQSDKIKLLDELVGTYDSEAKTYPYVNGTEEQREMSDVMHHYAAIVYAIEPEYVQADAIQIIEGVLLTDASYTPGTFKDLVGQFKRDVDSLYAKTMEEK